jgi:dTMP kinase
MSGFFITLEGGEGAGKSSLIRKLEEHLATLLPNETILVTREPGASTIGQPVRDIILSLDNLGRELDPKAEALLFAADRAQHMAEKITPALTNGNIVICDRFIDSSYAYQAVGRDLGDFVLELSTWAISGRVPDLTIIIDIDPVVGLSRKNEQKELNKMEQESIEFHKKVREAFLTLSNSGDPRFFVIDGNQSIEHIYHKAIKKIESQLLNYLNNKKY